MTIDTTYLDLDSDYIKPARPAILAMANWINDLGMVPMADYGTDDTAVAAALAEVAQTGRSIHLGGQTLTFAAAPTNTYGTRYVEGRALVDVATGTTALQSYAPQANGLYWGREHLSAFWRQASANGTIAAYVYGDSTVEQSGAYTVPCHTMIKQAAWGAGINKITVTNRGASGTSWSDLSATGDLASTTKLMVIKYGINDAVKGSALATIAADARTKLAAIRAAANGDIESLSILLMLPTSTYRPSTGQDAKWYEPLRNLYIQLAQEYQCAVFDTYAWMQDTTTAAGFWLDDLGSGEGIHPDFTQTYLTWWAPFAEHVFASGQGNSQKANQFWNLSYATRVPSTATAPTGYPYGITVESVLVSDGWPLDGTMITVRGADSGVAVQTIYSQDVVPRTCSRRGGASVWTQWSGVPTAAPAFTNSWANKGGGYANAGYQVGDDGWVDLYGVITGGTIGSSAFTLPSTARPAYAHEYRGGTVASVTVFADGTVVPGGAGTNSLVPLDGIRFRHGG